ncbi:protein of unknown function DUF1614 [Thermodesulfatator indicus DSM 15286]|uniref:DUF1614 domain-containing protein n=1 Tax=Thermodesulfatator indicus (strain DSM 15286 / JCM 11887 / CIR29812) TaxID=667014 RepID=F8A9Q5_THEID|nr:DUF1614 domain-containing protein [Thermodesulfatator indicus]AEH45690.1 protein of unknown function DUF1614 [Thermodesulfatator indicus DSM 15286]
MIFSPFAILFFFLFLFLLFLLFIFVHIGLITIAASKLGLTAGQVFIFLFGSLIGSNINIPVKKIRRDRELYPEEVEVTFFGIRYVIPRVREPSYTIIAVNVGGCVIPVFVSLYLMVQNGLFISPLIATAIVAFICYKLARPVPGIGIAIPMFIPPLAAALIALVISPDKAPVVAYISGTLGTLIGADILHLRDINRLKAPVASIGGAGTFDGIFLTGIIAVILA